MMELVRVVVLRHRLEMLLVCYVLAGGHAHHVYSLLLIFFLTLSLQAKLLLEVLDLFHVLLVFLFVLLGQLFKSLLQVLEVGFTFLGLCSLLVFIFFLPALGYLLLPFVSLLLLQELVQILLVKVIFIIVLGLRRLLHSLLYRHLLQRILIELTAIDLRKAYPRIYTLCKHFNGPGLSDEHSCCDDPGMQVERHFHSFITTLIV